MSPTVARLIAPALLAIAVATARDTAAVLREFLGRPVSPDALIADIARISDE